MSKDYKEHLAQDRRLCILRLLEEAGGEANTNVMHSSLELLGYGRTPHDDVKSDVRFLMDNGCVIDNWYGSVQVLTITRRGVEVANGVVTIEGIKKPSIGV